MPINWICFSASSLAPSPIESMAMTAATPKMIPRAVRMERSMWLRKPSRPISMLS